MSRTSRVLGSVATCVALLVFAGTSVPVAHAAKQDAKVDAATARRLERLRLQLGGDNPATAAAALESIGAERFEPATGLLRDFINQGSTPDLIALAAKAAGMLRAAELAPVVAPLVAHRDEEVRRRAAEALIQIGGPRAVEALRAALRGPDARVRGIAAAGLGDLGAREALPELFKAFDRNVGEAASAIGQVCDPDACRKFLASLGKAPFDLVTSGFDQMFFRPASELPDDVKIDVIDALAKLQTNEVSKYLAELRARSGAAEWTPALQKALDRAIKRTGGQ